MKSKKPDSIDEYISRFSGVVAERLEAIRQTIAKALPDAEEIISYSMPAYHYRGKVAVYFAGYERHVGFYPTPSCMRAFEDKLSNHVHSKGAVQFRHDERLPRTLIREMVLFRKKELLSDSDK